MQLLTQRAGNSFEQEEPWTWTFEPWTLADAPTHLVKGASACCAGTEGHARDGALGRVRHRAASHARRESRGFGEPSREKRRIEMRSCGEASLTQDESTCTISSCVTCLCICVFGLLKQLKHSLTRRCKSKLLQTLMVHHGSWLLQCDHPVMASTNPVG